jgi:hypothetical protein
MSMPANLYGYHVHIYFDDTSKGRATTLHDTHPGRAVQNAAQQAPVHWYRRAARRWWNFIPARRAAILRVRGTDQAAEQTIAAPYLPHSPASARRRIFDGAAEANSSRWPAQSRQRVALNGR